MVRVVTGWLHACLQGVLCLMGHHRKNLKDWDACKKLFKNSRKCQDSMLEMSQTEPAPGSKEEAKAVKKGAQEIAHVHPKDMENRWSEFNM